MSARSCPGCEREFRKGTLAFVLDPVTGDTKRKRVCATCASRGITVVAPRQTPIVKGLKVAKSADEDLERIARQVRTLAKAARMSAIQHADDAAGPHQLGRGLESALELLVRQ